jgi:hypothetical protein
MDDMRLSFTPSALGVKYNYLIHRTRARLPFPDGKTREGVLVLEPNINSRLLAGAGARITQIGFKKRDIRLDKVDAGWRIQMIHMGETLYDATISFAESRTELPPGSCFSDPAEADRFLLGVSHGGEWARERACLYLLPETHEPWQTLVSSCETRVNRFLDELGYSQAVADHVITMADIPHYFGLRPVTVKLGKA